MGNPDSTDNLEIIDELDGPVTEGVGTPVPGPPALPMPLSRRKRPSLAWFGDLPRETQEALLDVIQGRVPHGNGRVVHAVRAAGSDAKN